MNDSGSRTAPFAGDDCAAQHEGRPDGTRTAVPRCRLAAPDGQRGFAYNWLWSSDRAARLQITPPAMASAAMARTPVSAQAARAPADARRAPRHRGRSAEGSQAVGPFGAEMGPAVRTPLSRTARSRMPAGRPPYSVR